MKMECPRCHKQIAAATKVCPYCGQRIDYGGNTEFFGKAANETLSIGDIFSGVLHSHTKKDRDKLFMAGTGETTPKENEMFREWRKPWLFARVLLIGLILTIAMYWMAKNTPVALAGYFILSASFIPVAMLIFFWELNIPRNIPFYEILLMLLAGGILSLIVTGILNNFITGPESMGSSFAAFIEEPAKIAALSVFLRKADKKYILNGILIGAAVGAGFACFESAGYVFMYSNTYDDLIQLAIIRGAGNLGSHAVYAAIEGGALAMVKKQRDLSASDFAQVDFLKFMVVPVILHYLNNSDLYLFTIGPVEMGRMILNLIGWAVLFILIKKGIQQVLDITNSFPFQMNTAHQSTHQLIGVNGIYQGQIFPIEKGQLVFGRDAKTCNILFPQYAKGISRVHCTLRYDGQRFYLTDHKSSNGTWLENGKRIPSGMEMELTCNQHFYLGNNENMFEIR